MPNQPHTAFVLSGGGSLGAVQVGMLRALYEREIAPELIVGTSAGALNGAFIASRPQSVATAEELAEVWRRLDRGTIFPLNPLTGLLGFLGRRNSLVSPRGIRQLLRKHLEMDRLEQARIPLHVIATDLLTGNERRLSRGDTARAVQASAAIPGVFPPVELEGRTLIDGGVSNNAPITHALELGAERVYVLATGYACALRRAPRGALETVLHAMSLLVMRRLIVEVEHLEDQAELLVLPPPCPSDVLPADFGHAAELIERSYQDTALYLDGAAAGGIPPALEPHGHERASAGIAIPAEAEAGSRSGPARTGNLTGLRSRLLSGGAR